MKAPDDAIVFGKVGTSGPAFQKAMTGKKVLDANQQGKYFWFAALVPCVFNCPLTNTLNRLIMSSPPHPVFHLGMTGIEIYSTDCLSSVDIYRLDSYSRRTYRALSAKGKQRRGRMASKILEIHTGD